MWNPDGIGGNVALDLIAHSRERFDRAMPMVTEALEADAELAERCADVGATIDAAECFARPSGSTRARGDATAGGQRSAAGRLIAPTAPSTLSGENARGYFNAPRSDPAVVGCTERLPVKIPLVLIGRNSIGL